MARSKKKSKSSMRQKARERAEKNKGGGGNNYLDLPEDTEFFKPKKGRQSIDFLPYEVTVDSHPEVDKGDTWYQRDVFLHYNVGIDELTVICPKTIGKKCPICEDVKEMRREKNVDKKAIDAIKQKHRELFNIYDPEEDKVLLWEFSYFNFGEKLNEEIREGDEEYAGFAELEEGMTLEIRFAEASFNKNKYLEVSRIDFKERDPFDEEILEDVYNLDSLLVVLPYDQIQKIYLEIDDEEDEQQEEEEEDESETNRKSKRGSRRSRSRNDDDDGDDDDSDVSGEDDGDVDGDDDYNDGDDDDSDDSDDDYNDGADDDDEDNTGSDAGADDDDGDEDEKSRRTRRRRTDTKTKSRSKRTTSRNKRSSRQDKGEDNTRKKSGGRTRKRRR